MTGRRPPADNLGALAEITRLINTRQIQEAHELLAAIEADPHNEAWKRPLTVGALRDRITNAKGQG